MKRTTKCMIGSALGFVTALALVVLLPLAEPAPARAARAVGEMRLVTPTPADLRACVVDCLGAFPISTEMPGATATATATATPSATATSTPTVTFTPTDVTFPSPTPTATVTPTQEVLDYTPVPADNCLLTTRAQGANVRTQPWVEPPLTTLPGDTTFAAIGWKRADDGTLWVRRLLGGYVARWILDYRSGCPGTIVELGPFQ